MVNRETPKRRFTLLDAMFLVAATAIALAASRASVPEVRRMEREIAGAWTCLATLSWAVLCLRLKRPRPDLRRLMSRPGHATCVAASLTTVLTVVLCAIAYIKGELSGNSGFRFSDAPVIGAVATAPAVMASWLLMALSGRWRLEIDWIGRLGRFLAVG